MSAIPFSIVNLDTPRELRFDMRAMTAYEDLTGEAVFGLLGALTFTQCINVLWTCMWIVDNKVTKEEVMDLIDSYCEVTQLVQETTKLITNAFKQRKGKSDPNLKPTQSKS